MTRPNLRAKLAVSEISARFSVSSSRGAVLSVSRLLALQPGVLWEQHFPLKEEEAGAEKKPHRALLL